MDWTTTKYRYYKEKQAYIVSVRNWKKLFKKLAQIPLTMESEHGIVKLRWGMNLSELLLFNQLLRKQKSMKRLKKDKKIVDKQKHLW